MAPNSERIFAGNRQMYDLATIINNLLFQRAALTDHQGPPAGLTNGTGDFHSGDFSATNIQFRHHLHNGFAGQVYGMGYRKGKSVAHVQILSLNCLLSHN